MKLNTIQIILDDSGVMVDEYTILPSINQYATNYELNVAFLNDMSSARSMKAVFNINGKNTPAKVLSPTLERIDLGDGKKSYYSHSYQLTQYETQFYQPELKINIYIYNETNSQIANVSVLLPMNKQNFNKLTPADLDTDSSINSVVDAIYDLEAAVISHAGIDIEYETKEEAAAKLEEAKAYTDSEIIELKGTISSNYASYHYVDIQDNNNYNKSKAYTDSKISELPSTGDIITQANEYTDSKILEHNTASDSHTDIRSSLTNKVEQTYLAENYYTKTTIDAKFTSLDNYATTEYVNNSITTTIEGIVGAAPETLNTLKELSAALGDDPNFATTVSTELSKKADKTDVESNNSKIENINNALEDYVNTINSQVGNIQNDIIQLYETTLKSNEVERVALTGNYNDLKNTPTNLSEFNNDLGVSTVILRTWED